VIVAADPAAAASAAAELIASRVRAAVRARGTASVAFSGGSTPALMLADLAQRSLPWPSVEVFQVDERRAPDGDPARNLGLLDVLPVRRRQVHAMPVNGARPAVAAARYAASLPARLDVVHLGLGDDGHTASWAPGDPVIDEAEPVGWCGTYAGYERMTLTPPVVASARARIVLAVGASKRPMVSRWLDGDRSLPIARVRRTGTVVVLDAAADPSRGRSRGPGSPATGAH
jgi:6-phosphogluconolactonase